jgi:PhnB protein
MQLSTYLFFKGNCQEAFKFYERVLGGKIETVHTYAGMPAGPGNTIPAGWKDKIMHIHLSVDDQALLGSDAPPGHQDHAQGGFSVSLSLNDIVKGERVFRALAENGTVRMEFQKTFWAERFGMVTDQFGIPWMINCEKAA